MSHAPQQLRALSDDELLCRLKATLARSRRIESELVAHIAEVDRRRLYAREAAPSMFAYCTEVLHLSEQAAYLRIAVARASRQHSQLLPMLADGRLHLTAVAKLAGHLTPENRDDLLARATHRSKREVEELIAELAPRPEVAPAIRRLPSPRQAVPLPPGNGRPSHRSSSRPSHPATSLQTTPPGLQLGPDRVEPLTLTSPPRPARVEPLAPARYRVQFTASAQLREKLERLQALCPGADVAEVIEQAVTDRLERLEARRFAKVAKPRRSLDDATRLPSSRYIPAPVRRAVYERDGGRCSYADSHGRRCSSRRDLEFHHHEQPYGRGGEHSVENLRLMCPTHNALLAERDYGTAAMARHRRSGGRVSEGGVPYGPSVVAMPLTRRLAAG